MLDESKNHILKALERNLFLSDLPMEKKAFWKNILLKADIYQLQIIAEALEEDKQNLQILTRNLEDKFRAVKSKNKLTWDEIVKNEGKALRND